MVSEWLYLRRCSGSRFDGRRFKAALSGTLLEFTAGTVAQRRPAMQEESVAGNPAHPIPGSGSLPDSAGHPKPGQPQGASCLTATSDEA